MNPRCTIVDDQGYGRLLTEIVVQVEAEADGHKVQKIASQTSAARRSSRAGQDAVVCMCTRDVPLVRQKNVQRLDGCDESFLHSVVTGSAYSELTRFSMLREPSILANQSRKGRKNPEPGTGVPGRETNGNQVPFRGRHNQLTGSSQFQSQIHVFSPTAGCPFRVIPAAGDIAFDHPTVRPAGWAVSIRFQQGSSPVRPQIHSANAMRESF